TAVGESLASGPSSSNVRRSPSQNVARESGGRPRRKPPAGRHERSLVMSPSKKREVVAGSQRAALPQAKVVGEVDPSERIQITVMVRPRPGGGAARARAGRSGERGVGGECRW